MFIFRVIQVVFLEKKLIYLSNRCILYDFKNPGKSQPQPEVPLVSSFFFLKSTK